MNQIYRCLDFIFRVTLIVFILMAAAIVFGQAVGILFGNGALVLGINSALKTYATWISSICGMAAMFSRNFMPKKQENQGEK